jgi:putative heme-binding domain-containing protein
MDAAGLARLLGDPRFAVRDRAVAALARLGKNALSALGQALKSDAPRTRLLAVQALNRIDAPEARRLNREALGDADAGVRQAAAGAAGIRADGDARERLEALIVSGEPSVRREAATALSRLRAPESVPAVFRALAARPDRFTEHALIYALISTDDPEATRRGLKDPNPAVRKGALVALDQMHGGGLTFAQVAPLLNPSQPELRDEAARVATRHPEWAGPMASTIRGWLTERSNRARLTAIRRQLLVYAGDPAIRSLIAESAADGSLPVPSRSMLLEVIGATTASEWPASWDAAVTAALGDRNNRVAAQAVTAVLSSGRAGFEAALTALAGDTSRPTDLRVEAADAVAPRLSRIEGPMFESLLKWLGPDEAPLRRFAAARALGRAPLDEEQVLKLTASLPAAGPLALPRLLPAFERTTDSRVGLALVEALAHSHGLEGLSRETLDKLLAPYPEEVRRRAEPLYRRVDPPEQSKASRLAELGSQLPGGDPRSGREVFFGPRAVCSTCHAVRGEGAHVGPDLTRIGEARAPRDLLEAILYPSASFARGYEPFMIATRDGRVHHGIIVRETSSSFVLATPDRAEVILPRASIEEIQPAKVSVMPQGLEANLTKQELLDVVAFLGTLR